MADSPLDAPVTLPGRPILGLLAGATAFRRDAFMQAGGYHPRYFLGGEEALLALDLYRAGGWLVYAPRLTVHHHPSPQRGAHARPRHRPQRGMDCLAQMAGPGRAAADRAAAAAPVARPHARAHVRGPGVDPA